MVWKRKIEDETSFLSLWEEIVCRSDSGGGFEMGHPTNKFPVSLGKLWVPGDPKWKKGKARTTLLHLSCLMPAGDECWGYSHTAGLTASAEPPKFISGTPS